MRLLIKFSWDALAFAFSVLWKRPSASILLSIACPGSVGGTEFQVNQIAEALHKLKKRPLVLVIGKVSNKKKHLFLRRLKNQKIPYLYMGLFGFTKNRFLQKVIALLLKRLKASIYHCFNPLSSVLIPIAKQAGLKIFYTETGLPIQDAWWSPLFPQIHLIDLVIGISGASLDHFRTLFPYQGPTAIFYPLINPPPPSLPAFKHEEFQIVYFGRMCRNKGVHQLLEAFRTVCAHHPAHLTFIGEGREQKFLQSQALAWNIEKRTHFIDFQKQEKLLERISMFDVFCLPSFSEGMPCTILEAMSIGLPVIATRIGGIPEIVVDQVSGVLVPVGNQQALVNALLLLAKDPILRKQIGANGLKKYKESFSLQKNSLETIYLCREISLTNSLSMRSNV